MIDEALATTILDEDQKRRVRRALRRTNATRPDRVTISEISPAGLVTIDVRYSDRRRFVIDVNTGATKEDLLA